MTVRRYSTNCSLAGVSERGRGPDLNMYASSTSGDEDVAPSRGSLQEYVHKNRSI